ncbi:MAG: SpoVA/SpoVAEb family sporulation membrane protein, partial [Clostridia bacterium]|nr:SpoVA/SpoVAEb family sporulation membrane protein [Clostridia bacterium]
MKGNNLNANYLDYVSKISPKTHEWEKIFHAFWVGGLICTIGQALRILLETYVGLSGDEFSAWVSACMIFLGRLLTGPAVYDGIVK